MKIRLHEIELGTEAVRESTGFFQSILGLQPTVQQESLTVFDSGTAGLDFNLSNHLPAGTVAVSFFTDDLPAVEQKLQQAGVKYEGPKASHLGMTAIRFQSPEGFTVVVNTAGPASPGWLRVR